MQSKSFKYSNQVQFQFSQATVARLLQKVIRDCSTLFVSSCFFAARPITDKRYLKKSVSLIFFKKILSMRNNDKQQGNKQQTSLYQMRKNRLEELRLNFFEIIKWNSSCRSHRSKPPIQQHPHSRRLFRVSAEIRKHFNIFLHLHVRSMMGQNYSPPNNTHDRIFHRGNMIFVRWTSCG